MKMLKKEQAEMNKIFKQEYTGYRKAVFWHTLRSANATIIEKWPRSNYLLLVERAVGRDAKKVANIYMHL